MFDVSWLMHPSQLKDADFLGCTGGVLTVGVIQCMESNITKCIILEE